MWLECIFQKSVVACLASVIYIVSTVVCQEQLNRACSFLRLLFLKTTNISHKGLERVRGRCSKMPWSCFPLFPLLLKAGFCQVMLYFIHGSAEENTGSCFFDLRIASSAFLLLPLQHFHFTFFLTKFTTSPDWKLAQIRGLVHVLK